MMSDGRASRGGRGIGGPWSRIAGERKRDRRSVEQGPACGMRPWSRSRRVASNADPCASPGVRSQRVPLSPLDAPRVFRGSDLEGGHWAAVPLRLISGRIPNKWGPCSTSTAAPLAGCDRGAGQGRVAQNADPMRVFGVRSPKKHWGPSSALRRAPNLFGDLTPGGALGGRHRVTAILQRRFGGRRWVSNREQVSSRRVNSTTYDT
jgi:hypothetical protein